MCIRDSPRHPDAADLRVQHDGVRLSGSGPLRPAAPGRRGDRPIPERAGADSHHAPARSLRERHDDDHVTLDELLDRWDHGGHHRADGHHHHGPDELRPDALLTGPPVTAGARRHPRSRHRGPPGSARTGQAARAAQTSAVASSSPWDSVFQLRVAHLIRTGNLTTPCSAASSPRASMSMASGSGASSGSPPSPAAAGSVASWIDIIPLKVAISSRASSTVLTLTAAHISDADDWLIEQPVPPILMSATTPSSTSSVTTISSPHPRPSAWRGSTRCAASSPRFRGDR